MTFRFERGQEANLGLPRDLGNGLVLRWCTPEDTEPLAKFLGDIFAEDGEPDEGIIAGMRDLMSNTHPFVGAGDFTIVTDENQNGKIVSTLGLLSQIWAYDGVAFGVGQIEGVATDPEYRRKGLVRQQMNLMHARSAGRGEQMQVIGGTAWYYRQFGYDMALAMRGERNLYWANISKLEKGQAETYRIRLATPDDIELLARLYDIHCQSSLVTQVRSETEWHYELTSVHPLSEIYRRFYMIEEIASGNPIAYVEIGNYPEALAVRELAVLPGNPLRLVCEFLTRALKPLSEARATDEDKEEAYDYAIFSFGTDHPVYTALGKQLGHQNLPYAWYVRIADLPTFLQHIALVLNKRLAASVFDGYSGTLRLNFYRSFMTLVFDKGKLTEVGTYEPDHLEDGDAAFPELIFFQLLLGYRSMSELERAYCDCTVKDQRTATLLDALFPQRSSDVAASA